MNIKRWIEDNKFGLWCFGIGIVIVVIIISCIDLTSLKIYLHRPLKEISIGEAIFLFWFISILTRK